MAISTANFLAQGYSSASSTTTASFTSQSTYNGVVGVVHQAASLTVTDSKSNTWASQSKVTLNTGGSFTEYLEIFTCLAGTGGSSHTITASGTNGYATILAAEITGDSITLDDNDNVEDTSPPFEASITTTVDNCIAIAFHSYGETSGTVSGNFGNGFTKQAEVTNSASWTGGVGSLSVASAGSVTTSLTVTGTTAGSAGAAVFAFYEASNNGASTAPAQTSSGSGVVSYIGTGTPSSPAQTSSGSGDIGGNNGASTAPAQTSSGTGLVSYIGTGTPSAPAQTSSGSGSSGSSIPSELEVWFINQSNGVDVTTQSFTTEAGMMLACIGRGVLADHATAAITDSKSNTYSAVDSSHAYTDWASSGTRLYSATLTSYGTSHTVTAERIQSNDEVTVAAVNVPGVNLIEDFDWSEDLTSPNTSGSVTISKAGYLVAFWWGDDSSGNDSFTDITSGWTILQYSTSTASNHVQCGIAFRQVGSGGTYSVEWTPNVSQGAQLYIVGLIDSSDTGSGGSESPAQTASGSGGVALAGTSSATAPAQTTAGLGLVSISGSGAYSVASQIASGRDTGSDTKGVVYACVSSVISNPVE